MQDCLNKYTLLDQKILYNFTYVVIVEQAYCYRFYTRNNTDLRKDNNLHEKTTVRH